MNAWYALFLGVVREIIEFIPISSCFHLYSRSTLIGDVESPSSMLQLPPSSNLDDFVDNVSCGFL